MTQLECKLRTLKLDSPLKNQFCSRDIFLSYQVHDDPNKDHHGLGNDLETFFNKLLRTNSNHHEDPSKDFWDSLMVGIFIFVHSKAEPEIKTWVWVDYLWDYPRRLERGNRTNVTEKSKGNTKPHFQAHC